MLTSFKSVNLLTSLKRRFTYYAFILVSVLLFFLVMIGCSATPPNKHRAAELVVEYNGKKVFERNPQFKAPLKPKRPQLVFNSIYDLKKALGGKTRPLVIIYSANWCKPCHILNQSLIKRGIRDKAVILNIDAPWVAHFINQYDIRGVPTMHVIGMNNKLYTFEGLGPILNTLAVIL